ncbi:MAG: hypothetical protein SXQ77_03935, partial [Halobacteria archaeon]|nr:hypothetical protein [Halobacteria archaeon]
MNKVPSIYEVNQGIQLNFHRRSGANPSVFAGEDAQLLVGHMETDAADSISSVDGAINLLNDLGNANARADWQVYDDGDNPNVGNLDNSTGEISMRYTPDDAGVYTFVLVNKSTPNSGFTASNGNLSLSGNVTVIGITSTIVRANTRSTVSPNTVNVDRGETVEFDVNTGLTSGDVNHAVVVYNHRQLRRQDTTFVIEEQLSTSLGSEDITIETTIGDVNGVANLNDSVSILGAELEDNSV